ncbi:hypothetical protein FB566_3942 [Stackebrandtia endophytica]|uniref:Uncharacterized protein n=1 Tax=Stackebrandtia endophytica TaxID=1496996 RepID=A0A543B0L4_9ACTN|nr:hypothetical protein FB566_3942 [Stackebrandtia endophytica]
MRRPTAVVRRSRPRAAGRIPGAGTRTVRRPIAAAPRSRPRVAGWRDRHRATRTGSRPTRHGNSRSSVRPVRRLLRRAVRTRRVTLRCSSVRRGSSSLARRRPVRRLLRRAVRTRRVTLRCSSVRRGSSSLARRRPVRRLLRRAVRTRRDMHPSSSVRRGSSSLARRRAVSSRPRNHHRVGSPRPTFPVRRLANSGAPNPSRRAPPPRTGRPVIHRPVAPPRTRRSRRHRRRTGHRPTSSRPPRSSVWTAGNRSVGEFRKAAPQRLRDARCRSRSHPSRVRRGRHLPEVNRTGLSNRVRPDRLPAAGSTAKPRRPLRRARHRSRPLPNNRPDRRSNPSNRLDRPVRLPPHLARVTSPSVWDNRSSPRRRNARCSGRRSYRHGTPAARDPPTRFRCRRRPRVFPAPPRHHRCRARPHPGHRARARRRGHPPAA